jgi:hypothetical protein
MGIPTRYTVGPSSGTHTASPTTNRLGVYMYAGGGGGGGGGNQRGGGGGGAGGFGFYNAPITQPFAQPFSVGGGGGGGGIYGAGSTGGATNLTNVGTVNGGNGGAGGLGPAGPGPAPGNSGNAPGASFTYPNRNFIIVAEYGPGGSAGNPVCASPTTGGTGTPGALLIFENNGT